MAALDVQVDRWTELTDTGRPTLLNSNQHTHTLLEMEPANTMPLLDKPKSPNMLMSQPTTKLLFKLLPTLDQSQLLLKLTNLSSKATLVESLPTMESAELDLTTESQSLDTDHLAARTTSLSRTHGAQAGEKADT